MNIQEFQDILNNSNHSLKDNEAAVQDMFRLVSNFNEKNKRPFHMYCSVTGDRVGMAQEKVFRKRLEKFNGNIVDLFVGYVSRSAKKQESNAAPVLEPEPQAVEASEMVEPEVLVVIEDA